MRRFLSIAALALIVTACLGSDFADSVEGDWRLVSGTVDGTDVPILEANPINIAFEGAQVSGNAGCNRYSGAFSIDGSSISFGDLAITEMACLEDQVMETEVLYMSGLLGVDAVSLDDNLILSGPGVELMFTPNS